MKLMRRILIITLMMFSPGLVAEALDRDTVLDRLVASYGGEENLRKLDSVVQEWDMVALMSKRHGTDVRSIHAPEQLRVELSYPDRSETRILDGEDGWVVFRESGPVKATPPQRDAMRLQLMRLYSPLVLRENSEAVTLVNEGDYCALSLVEHGVQADYLVNKETWRIEKVAGNLTMGGRPMQFLTEYSEFEFVDGVLVHQRENKYAGEVNTAVLQLRRISLDAGFEEKSFDPHGPGAD